VSEFFKHRPLNLAHRGASYDAPENTLAAFDLALRLGADGIELDVQLSADGVPVVIHDWTLDRTTDGQGPVATWRWAELRTLDAGSWFDSAYARQRIPSLEDVFAAFGRRLRYNIELKVRGLRSNGLERAVIAMIHRHGLTNRVLVSSFNPLALRRVGRLEPHLETGLLLAPEQPIYLRRAWLAPFVPHTARLPKYPLVDASYMAWARRRGYRVGVWTVDDPDEMMRLADLGVDAIITNRPDVLGRALAAAGRERSSRLA